MPVVTLAVPQSNETVSRYVLRGVINDLMKAVEFPSDTDVIFREEIGGPPTTGGTLNTTADVKLTNDNHVIVSNNETYSEPLIVTSVLHKQEYPYIFMDRDLGIYVKPSYGIVKNAVTVKLNFRDKSFGDRFRRLLRIRGGVRTLTNKHEIRYEYTLPDEILAFLFDAYSMMEPNDVGIKESLPAYLARCFKGGLGRRTTQSGGSSRLMIDEVQGNIIGTYVDEIFYNELSFEDGHWGLEFTYNFEYNMILGMVMEFPNVIHNKRIPKAYRKAWVAQPPIKDFQSEDIVHKTVSYMPPIDNNHVYRFSSNDNSYRIDPADDWNPKHDVPGVFPAVQAPILVDLADPYFIVNLHDFTPEQLAPDIKEYILRYPVDSLILNATPYFLQVFQVDKQTLETTVVIYPNGDIKSVLPLSPKKRHFIRISYLTDMSKLSYVHVAKMIEDPVATLNVFKHLYPEVDTESGEWLKVVGNKKITANSIRATIKKLPTTNREYAKLNETHPKYISNINIISNSKQ